MKKLMVLMAVALIAAGGGSIYLWRQLDAERQLNADLQQRMKALESAQRSFASFFTPREQPAAAGTDTPTAAPVDPAAAREQRRQNAQRAISQARESLAKPETRQAMTGMVRAMLPLALPDLGKELNLSPEELNRFYDLLGKQTGGLIGQFAGGASLQNMAGNAEQNRQAGEAQIAALLGDKYPQWKDYESTLPQRTRVNQLQNTLAASGNKLGDEQIKPLIAALSAEQRRITQEGNSTPAAPNLSPQERREQMQQRTASNNQRMVEAASPYMTASQLDAYKAMLERPAAGMRGMLGAGAGVRGGATSGAAAPR